MPLTARVAAVEYFLPAGILANEQLAAEFPEWPAQKIEEKTGIALRHIVSQDECASDLAVEAARKLLASGACRPEDVDFVLLCTQSPDYFLPTTACVIQHRLGIRPGSGALDFNLGCSGFVYGLGLAQGLVQTGQARKVLLLTAETYSKHMHARDKSVRTLFGDGAAATLVEACDTPAEGPLIGPFVYGTDGTGAPHLIVPGGGMRRRVAAGGAVNLFMNGPEIFNFALRAVPKTVHDLLCAEGLSLSDIDLFIFHQANAYILEHLRKKLHIPRERFCTALRDCGNTVSSTIPIALKQALDNGQLQRGDRIMLVGFGVGYSWAGALMRWI